MYNIIMSNKKQVRTQIYLTENQQDFLKQYSSDLGINKSELIRRILDEWIESKKIS